MGWLIGAAINLAGSVAINLGTNVMKLGHNKRAMLDLPEEERPPVRKFREWQIGMFFFIVGNVANFVSFGFAAQSLLAALGSVQFVSNVIFASFVLKEKVTFSIIMATTCIIGGCLMLVLFGNHTSDEYTVDDLLNLYKHPGYIIYLVMMFVFVFGSYIVYLHGKKVSMQPGRGDSVWVSLLPVTYAIFSALLGTQSVLFSKSLSVLLRSTISGDNQLGNWYTWVTLICFLCTAGFWVTRLNKGLRSFPAMIIVPMMQIAWTLFSIVSGMLYFQEYKTFTTLSAAMFSVGVMTVFVGVFLLTKGGRAKQEEYEPAEGDDSKKVDMQVNPAYDEADIPQKKLNMDTLRFTSLASNTTVVAFDRLKSGRIAALKVADVAGLNHTQMNSTMRDDDQSEMSNTMNTTTARNHFRSTLDGVAEDGDDKSSMMGTLKKGVKNVQHRLKKDFNVDFKDTTKQMFGMGDGSMPALSLFAMPAVDLTSSGKLRKPKERVGVDGHAILSALPQSRFYVKEEGEAGLEPIKEQPSGSLERSSAPLLSGPRSTDPEIAPVQRSTPVNSRPGSFTMPSNGARPSSFTTTRSSLEKSVALGKVLNKVETAASKAMKGVEEATKSGLAKIKDMPSTWQHSYQTLQDDEARDEEAGLSKAPSLQRPLRE